MRPWIVSELARHLLGPRHGPQEILERPPSYVLGVLAPSDEDTDIYDEPLHQGTEHAPQRVPQTADAQGDGNHDATTLHNPALDPTSRANSCGISFTTIEAPRFSLVLTWARYIQSPDDERYYRTPRAIHLEDFDSSGRQTILIAVQGRNCRIVSNRRDAEIEVTILGFPGITDKHPYTTTILMRNLLDRSGVGYREADIYQPQIRVNLIEGEYAGVSDSKSEDEYLYQERAERAQGHLCSAVWKRYDPQDMTDEDREKLQVLLGLDPNAAPDNHDFSEHPPWVWSDRDHHQIASISHQFYPPDYRTEFLPMVSIPAPDRSPWNDEWGRSPVLKASELAQATSPEQIRTLLEPLVTGYQNWIQSAFSSSNSIEQELRQKAEHVLIRMKRGVDVLCSDPQIRFAFNFANKAVDLNANWAEHRRNPAAPKKGITWYFFQMSFALLTLESVTNPRSRNRLDVDLLWVATGGGKTEAYLLIMALILALRRRKPNLLHAYDERQAYAHHGYGTAVITRYTLRLLTIQQFRRTLGVITAMEYLRLYNGQGWKPQSYDSEERYVWGLAPFSIGLWVGGGVSPNNCEKYNLSHLERGQVDQQSQNAITNLKFASQYPEVFSEKGEPAQILNCPCCESLLSVPKNWQQNKALIHWVVGVPPPTSEADLNAILSSIQIEGISCSLEGINSHPNDIKTLTFLLRSEAQLNRANIHNAWRFIQNQLRMFNVSLMSASPTNPGYFIRWYRGNRGARFGYDFDIYCPNPSCALNDVQEWCAVAPAGGLHDRPYADNCVAYPHVSNGSAFYRDVHTAWRSTQAPQFGRAVPIPAHTCDVQIYRHAPSVIIATVDKFARLPFKARASSIFGNVSHHNSIHGFHRMGADLDTADATYEPAASSYPLLEPNRERVTLRAPDLIIQDELHLIEGPLGSMVGFYETVVEGLINEGLGEGEKVKYIASTATTRSAQEQIQALFARKNTVMFPPKGPNWKDRGLICEQEEGCSEMSPGAGRLYVGLGPIGFSGLGLQRDLYGILLHSTNKIPQAPDGDTYWTVVGYHNAIRELAGSKALLDQDVITKLERLAHEEGLAQRDLDRSNVVELSGRMGSTDLPTMLQRLENRTRGSDAVDVLITTSMFGTGVDVNRLNVMIVGGQPKTTAQYIQATGRVGRKNGALVVTYLRLTRPRDLDHYERFLGYHLQQNRWVEPITVRPFTLPVIERAAGPISVAWMRHTRHATHTWQTKESAHEFRTIYSGVLGAHQPAELQTFVDLLTARNLSQPSRYQMDLSPPNMIEKILSSRWEFWERSLTDMASVAQIPIKYRGRPTGRFKSGRVVWSSYNPFADDPTWVVLGDERHIKDQVNHRAVFSPDHATPNSLRTVDSEIYVRERREP